MPPTSAKKHWSAVEPGQEFSIELEYDDTVYTAKTVSIKLRRHPETGVRRPDEKTGY